MTSYPDHHPTCVDCGAELGAEQTLSYLDDLDREGSDAPDPVCTACPACGVCMESDKDNCAAARHDRGEAGEAA